jgi:hypothetical protein
MHVRSVTGNPARADGFTVGFEYAGTGNVPASVAVTLDQASGGVAQEGTTYGLFALNRTTNVDTLGAFFGGDAAVGFQGNNQSTAVNQGAGVGVEGFASSKSFLNVGVSGFATASINTQTNVGSSGIAAINGHTGGAQVGGYSAIVADNTVDPIMESAAHIFDNGSSGSPVSIWRANGVNQQKVDGTGNLLNNQSARLHALIVTNEEAIVLASWANSPSGALDMAVSGYTYTISAASAITSFSNTRIGTLMNFTSFNVTNAGASVLGITVTAANFVSSDGTRTYYVTNGQQREIRFSSSVMGIKGISSPWY